MNTMENLIAAYLEKDRAANEGLKPLDGLFGFGKKPGDDACHEWFLDALAAETERMISGGIKGTDASSAASALLHAAADTGLTASAKWTLVAAEKTILPLIERMPAGDKQSLLAWYDRAVPKRRRLPVEKEIAAALKA